jgi:hypothetical protein
MGDYYLFQSDTLNAIKEFKNGLEIGEKPTLREKLEKLEKKSVKKNEMETRPINNKSSGQK